MLLEAPFSSYRAPSLIPQDAEDEGSVSMKLRAALGKQISPGDPHNPDFSFEPRPYNDQPNVPQEHSYGQIPSNSQLQRPGLQRQFQDYELQHNMPENMQNSPFSPVPIKPKRQNINPYVPDGDDLQESIIEEKKNEIPEDEPSYRNPYMGGPLSRAKPADLEPDDYEDDY